MLGEAAPGFDASLPQLPQSPERQAPPPTSLFAGSSQSWERLNAKQQRTLEGEGGCQTLAGLSHPRLGLQGPEMLLTAARMIWTQPGLRRKDQRAGTTSPRWAGWSRAPPATGAAPARWGQGGSPLSGPRPHPSPPLLRPGRHHHLLQPMVSPQPVMRLLAGQQLHGVL